MKGPFFNDVSVFPLCATDDEIDIRIDEFVKILDFCGFLGFKKVRFDKRADALELRPGYYLKDYLSANARRNGNRALLILNMFQSPYIDGDSVAEERYLSHTARLQKDGGEIEAEGLSSAYYSGGFSIGFASENFWKDNISFTLTVTDDSTLKSREHKVFCISCISQFSNNSFIKWAIKELPLQFRASNLPYHSKSVALRDDHGKKELTEFSKLIKNEPYIIEVINSLPFNKNAKRMTRINEDGLIEIRLLGNKNKIGILVRTTACNNLESMYLATDIEQKYG